MAAQWVAATTMGVSIAVAAGAALVSYSTGGFDLAALGFVTGISAAELQAWLVKDGL